MPVVTLQSSRVRQLHGFSHRLVAAADSDSVAQALFEAAAGVSGVNAITFRLRNSVTDVFEPIACHNLDLEEWRLAAPLGAAGLSRSVINSKQAVIVKDLQNLSGVQNASFLKKHGLISYLGVPLLSAAGVHGVVGFYSTRSRGFDQDDIELLMVITEVAALALASKGQQARPSLDANPILRSRSESSEQARGEFLNVMSHEFRTPLSLIMGHAGMMREGLLGEVNAEQRNSLDRVMENSDNLLAMVLSILQVSRIEAGGITLIARPIVIKELFTELQRNYANQENDGRNILWQCPVDLPALKTDRERLKDILRYLIDNAVKFTAQGRIVISAESTSDPAGIRFTVADTGVGIPNEALSFIFEKFRQSDSSVTRAFDGAGLGLYIAKKYADLLGGELSVVSEVGSGSTFTLKLPVAI